MMLGRWIIPVVVLAGLAVDPPPRPATSCSCFESFEESVDGLFAADFVFLAKAMDVEPRSLAYDLGPRSVLFAILFERRILPGRAVLEWRGI